MQKQDFDYEKLTEKANTCSIFSLDILHDQGVAFECSNGKVVRAFKETV